MIRWVKMSVTVTRYVVFLYTPENLRIYVPKLYILVINRSKFQEANITGQFIPKVPKLNIQFDISSFNVFKKNKIYTFLKIDLFSLVPHTGTVFRMY